MAKVFNMATSVMYDYSIVTKAKFYIFNFTSETSLAGFTPHKKYPCLPVQINPEEITIDRHGETNKVTGKIYSKEGHYTETRMTLRYDIYDQYMIATQGGALDFGQISLENRNSTSLMVLRDDIAPHPKLRVLFSWGGTQIFGKLEQFELKTTVFSRWGTPLKGHADIVIRSEPLLANIDEKLYTYNLGKTPVGITAIAAISTLDTVERVANQSLLAASQALR